jgi:hypothetical protein
MCERCELLLLALLAFITGLLIGTRFRIEDKHHPGET